MKETTNIFKDRSHNKHETVDVQYPNTRSISDSSESSCPPPPPPISRGDHWKKEMILAASSTAQPHHKDSVESKASSSASSSSMSEMVPVASIPPPSRAHTKEDSSRHVQPPFTKLLSPFRISEDEDSVDDDGDVSGGNVNEDQDQDENIKLAADGQKMKDEERSNFDINAAAKSLRTPDFKEDIIRNKNDADHISKQVEHQRSADEGSSAPAPPPSARQDDPGEDHQDPPGHPDPPGQLTRFPDPVRLDCDYAASLPRLNTVANFRADM